MQIDNIIQYTEILRNIAQSFAFLIAAGWAIYLFIIKESPSLVPRVDITNSISWAKTNDENIYKAHFIITVKNIGITSFKISKVKVTAWRFPKKKLKSAEWQTEISISNLLLDKYIFYTKTYSEESEFPKKFISNYVPGMSKNATWNWLFRKDDNYWICIRAEFYTDDPEKYAWSARNWCDIGETKNSLGNQWVETK